MEPISTWVFSYPINAIGGVGKYMREVRKRAGLLLLSPILCLGFSLCQDCKPKIFRLSAKYRKTKKITPPFANHAKQKAVLKRMTFFPLGLGDSFSSRVSSCQKSLVYCFACFTRGKRTGGGGEVASFPAARAPPRPFSERLCDAGNLPKGHGSCCSWPRTVAAVARPSQSLACLCRDSSRAVCVLEMRVAPVLGAMAGGGRRTAGVTFRRGALPWKPRGCWCCCCCVAAAPLYSSGSPLAPAETPEGPARSTWASMPKRTTIPG